MELLVVAVIVVLLGMMAPALDPKLGGPNRTGVPSFSGANPLMGDGVVGWKPRDAFDPEAIRAGTGDAPHSGTGGRNYY